MTPPHWRGERAAARMRKPALQARIIDPQAARLRPARLILPRRSLLVNVNSSIANDPLLDRSGPGADFAFHLIQPSHSV